MMELLDYLRTDIPIQSFNLWISMSVEGAEKLLQEPYLIPWITAFRRLPVQQAVNFHVSTPDGYDMTRNKRVLAIVMDILMPDTIRAKVLTKHKQAVSHGTAEAVIFDGIEPWVAEELKNFDGKKPQWTLAR
jgi:hypothetical protein